MHAEAWLRARRLALSFGYSRQGRLPTMLVRRCDNHVLAQSSYPTSAILSAPVRRN